MMRQTLDAGLPELGLDLPESARQTLCDFGAAVIKQNEVMNLTAITQPDQVAKLHLLDSLTVLTAADLRGKQIIDVGCGAGFPGVPLAIACPEARVTLLDSLGKRMKWLEEILPQLGVRAQCVTARAEDEKAARKLVKPVVKELERRFGRAVYTTKNDVTLEDAVVRLLKKNDLTAATVESCTAGLLAGRLVNVPGVSDVFKTGLITYSNKAKRRLAGVKKETLEKYGAVSPQTAQEMAVGGAKAAGADVAVSITGIAGPDGGSEEKPVGLVYMACFVCGNVWVEEFRFKGSRAKIRESSVAAALTLMRRYILEVFD